MFWPWSNVGLVVGKHTLYSNDPSLLSYLLPNLQDDRFEVFGQFFKHLLSIWQNFESTYFVKSIATNEQILNKKSSHLLTLQVQLVRYLVLLLLL